MPRRTWLMLGGFAAILLVAALLVGVFESDGKSPAAATSDGDDSNVDDAVRKALTVTSVDDEYCLEKVVKYGGSTVATGDGMTVVTFNGRIGALEGTPPRLWSDALDTPYVKTDPQEMLGETQAEICENPLYGVTVAHFFATMSVGDVKLSEINDWLTPFAGDAGQINDKASEFVPLLDVTSPTDDDKGQAVRQNLAWQQVAGKLGTLLGRFQVVGVQAQASTLNYHLVAGGAVVGGLPEVGLNPNQENLPALVLQLTEKGACAPLKVIGFNQGDKRPEEFAPPACVTPTTAAPERPVTTTAKPRKPGKPTTTTVPQRKKIPTTTVPPATTIVPTTVPKQTTTTVQSGKQTPTTQAPPPTTAVPPPTTAQPSNGGQGDSGDGATNTTSPPTTQAPAPAPPTTSSPTTNPPPPAG